jgi:hypothetical protein
MFFFAVAVFLVIQPGDFSGRIDNRPQFGAWKSAHANTLLENIGNRLPTRWATLVVGNTKQALWPLAKFL